jgi:gliding motility-associated-like protein
MYPHRYTPLLAALLFLLLSMRAEATHNRAGEIHIQQIGPLTIRATIITWTKTSSASVDRDSLEICWGDGTCQMIARTNGNGVPLPNDVKYNTYVWEHTYAGQATYTISMTDLNRIAGIINVNPPTSDLVPFHVETSFTFQSVQFGIYNTTPYLLQPPIDRACVGKPFKHNPNAYDPDGDSISYQLIVPLQFSGETVPNYSFPSQVMPGGNNLLQLNAATGDLIWLSPQVQGDYNIAFFIISWRKGVAIDTTIRDMQIFVDQCENNPPIVTTKDEFCVVAGNTVAFEVAGNDLDSGNLVVLTALGGPLVSPFSPATFTVAQGWQTPVLKGTFNWVTDCEHISDQPYTVVFKATDTIQPNEPKLSDLKSVSIKVVGPAPEGVQATANAGEVEITWDKPYSCETTDNNSFYGFSVWRREGSNPFLPDTCAPGLDGKGYVELSFITKKEVNGRYYFKDSGVQRGRTYCYRVLAKFAKITAGGSPFNIVESLPSAEVCVQLPRDIPIINTVSVENTSNNAGQIKVCWDKPIAADLDTVLNPGPYRYQLLRASGLSGGTTVEVAGASIIAPSFSAPVDTCFTDNNLNTAGGPYNYQIAFYVNNSATPLGTTNNASSVFLNVGISDQRTVLTWQEEVPWNNYLYEVYRQDPATGQFAFIGTATSRRYEDTGLINGVEYCYKVRSIGTYGVVGITSPLYNWSQETCGIPRDTIPPCTPVLAIQNICTTGETLVAPDPPFENLLSWTNPAGCPTATDLAGFKVWYAPDKGQPLQTIATINDKDTTTYLHVLVGSLQGCYAVSSFDLLGNESPKSDSICITNCAFYQLPNTFTPNSDGQNDVFEPFPGWRFVSRIELVVYNRWGNKVYETQDPAIQWNGTDMGGQLLAEGTYHYTCRVFIPNIEGGELAFDTLSGWILLANAQR